MSADGLRAATLREAADELSRWLGMEEAVRELRRMADEGAEHGAD